jgi:hypothetical protein
MGDWQTWFGFACCSQRSSSLTAREVLTCLGPGLLHVEALDPDRAVYRSAAGSASSSVSASGADPSSKPSSEWLTNSRSTSCCPRRSKRGCSPPVLVPGVPVAVATAASFDRVQSKVEFARLLGELRLPQPRWRLISDRGDLRDLAFRYWLKSGFSTAGRGVRLVTEAGRAARCRGAAQSPGRSIATLKTMVNAAAVSHHRQALTA